MERYEMGSIIVTIGIFLAVYIGKYCKIHSFGGKIYKWYENAKMIVALIDGTGGNNINTNMNKFIVNDNDISANIKYEYLGIKYNITIPYNRSQIVRMNRFKLYLVNETGGNDDITQQPGIPYIMSAKEMGGTAIKLINKETGYTYMYKENEIPMYCENIKDEDSE